MGHYITATNHFRLGFALVMLCVTQLWGQQWNDPLLHYPRFEGCSEQSISALPDCFTEQFNLMLREASSGWEFNELSQDEVSVLFEVNKEGDFVLRYMDSPAESLRGDLNQFFSDLPQIQPASYNGRTIYMQFRMHFSPEA